MKRHGSSDSLGGLIAEEHCRRGDNNLVYSREFQNMLDGLDEEGCHVAEKKRRLSVEQVKALEKNFEVENKLEPERKVKLAQELGLQPRQVAVWFQNRRARWKTKQLERDYGVLKANFDSLKLDHHSLKLDHDALLKEIRELKSKLGEEDGKAESFDPSVKDEIMVAESEKIGHEQEQPGTAPAIFGSSEVKDLNFTDNLGSLFPDFKDGPSDSDSSAILNDDYYKTATRSPDAAAILMSPPPSSPERSGLQFQKMYQTQFVKLEEHNFFTGDEACDFFSDEQPPSLQQWWQSSWENRAN